MSTDDHPGPGQSAPDFGPADSAPQDLSTTQSRRPAPYGLAISVGQTASRLQREMLGDGSDSALAAARATLARLRRGAGRNPEADPLIFQEVLDLLDPHLPDNDLGRGEAASRSERAAFDALTLFALHMQSAKDPAHVRDRSFAAAVGTLVKRSESKSTKPRFDALLAARTNDARLTHMRSLITLLRGEQLGFDYGRFASDLRTLSTSRYSNVLLKWGRDFVIATYPDKTAEPSTN